MASVDPQTTFVTIQPLSQKIDPFKELNDNWNVGLMECCNDVSQCCYASWCCCCFLGTLAKKIDESWWSCCFVPYALAMYRMKVRSVLRIQGDTCSDHCAVLWCPLCAGLQMRNELTFRSLD